MCQLRWDGVWFHRNGRGKAGGVLYVSASQKLRRAGMPRVSLDRPLFGNHRRGLFVVIVVETRATEEQPSTKPRHSHRIGRTSWVTFVGAGERGPFDARARASEDVRAYSNTTQSRPGLRALCE